MNRGVSRTPTSGFAISSTKNTSILWSQVSVRNNKNSSKLYLAGWALNHQPLTKSCYASAFIAEQTTDVSPRYSGWCCNRCSDEPKKEIFLAQLEKFICWSKSTKSALRLWIPFATSTVPRHHERNILCFNDSYRFSVCESTKIGDYLVCFVFESLSPTDNFKDNLCGEIIGTSDILIKQFRFSLSRDDIDAIEEP